MNHCKDCKFWCLSWRNSNAGKEVMFCDAIGNKGVDEGPGMFDLVIWADDDSNLQGELVTGPEFGCTQFKHKEQ
jgi:hypothetical protein